MMTERELSDLAKQVWEAKMQTDNSLEEKALEAAIAALLQMQKRAKQTAAA